MLKVWVKVGKWKSEPASKESSYQSVISYYDTEYNIFLALPLNADWGYWNVLKNGVRGGCFV